MLQLFQQAQRMESVRYDIRGPLNAKAVEMEALGQPIVKLNIGNPALFGFQTPGHLREALAQNLSNSEAYVHQQGINEARSAIVGHFAARGVVVPAHQVYIGNGVSELIDLCLRALLNPGDEVLLPAPDYPLWTAAVHLNQGVPRYYDCLPANAGVPDVEQIEKLITKRTRALVIINPNNPTGAVYPKSVVAALAQLAERHGLIVLSDEIYDEIVYQDAEFHPVAPLVHDTLAISFGGLSKVHRACGYRVGWFVLSGAVKPARDFVKALDVLAALRLCSNVAGQFAVKPALTGPNTIHALCQPGGRLYEARQAILEGCKQSEFLELAAPMGAMYAFPGVDTTLIPDFDDQQFAMQLLEQERVLIVPGSSFNVPYRNHFRMTLLPEPQIIRQVFAAFERVLRSYSALPLAANG